MLKGELAILPKARVSCDHLGGKRSHVVWWSTTFMHANAERDLPCLEVPKPAVTSALADLLARSFPAAGVVAGSNLKRVK